MLAVNVSQQRRDLFCNPDGTTHQLPCLSRGASSHETPKKDAALSAYPALPYADSEHSSWLFAHLPLILGTDQLTSINLRATQLPEMLERRGASITSSRFLSFIQPQGTPAPAHCQPFRALSLDHFLVVLFSGNSSGRQWGNKEQWIQSTF